MKTLVTLLLATVSSAAIASSSLPSNIEGFNQPQPFLIKPGEVKQVSGDVTEYEPESGKRVMYSITCQSEVASAATLDEDNELKASPDHRKTKTDLMLQGVKGLTKLSTRRANKHYTWWLSDTHPDSVTPFFASDANNKLNIYLFNSSPNKEFNIACDFSPKPLMLELGSETESETAEEMSP